VRQHLLALSGLLGHAKDHLLGDDHDRTSTLRSDARTLDATYQALITTTRPLQRTLFGAVDEPAAQALRLVTAARNFGRDLVVDVDPVPDLDDATHADIARGVAVLRSSVDTLARAVTGSRDGTYVRSSSILDRAERRVEALPADRRRGQAALRDLKLVDGAMATLAGSVGLAVTDLDTVAVARSFAQR
jgi:hypothetical protein